MNAQRLLRLADHLETVVAQSPERFDMGTFAVQRPDCGTVCCALGHACEIPEFAAVGLRIDWEDESRRERRGWRYGRVRYDGLRDFAAAEALFDISDAAADYLFSIGTEDNDGRDRFDDDYQPPTPASVAARIRHFVKMTQQAGVEYTP